MSRRVGGAILIGIVAIAFAGIPLGLSHWPEHLFSVPHPSGTLFKLDLRGATKLGLGELVFVFFFVDLFDNVGTLIGVCEQGGFLRDGKLPRASRALLADAFGTMAGALTGTSTVTSYIESAAGVAAGAPTAPVPAASSSTSPRGANAANAPRSSSTSRRHASENSGPKSYSRRRYHQSSYSAARAR